MHTAYGLAGTSLLYIHISVTRMHLITIIFSVKQLATNLRQLSFSHGYVLQFIFVRLSLAISKLVLCKCVWTTPLFLFAFFHSFHVSNRTLFWDFPMSILSHEEYIVLE